MIQTYLEGIAPSLFFVIIIILFLLFFFFGTKKMPVSNFLVTNCTYQLILAYFPQQNRS